MNSWRRFWNMYRKDLIRMIIFILFILFCIRVLNEGVKKNNERKLEESKSISKADKIDKDKRYSIISDESFSQKDFQNVKSIISQFMECCNNGNVDEAYNFLSTECKEEVFPTKEYFKKIYIDKVFSTKKDHNIQAWIDYTFKVKIYEDMLASGKTLSDLSVLEDYYTIVLDNDEIKLNINGFVGKEQINKEVTKKDITIKVLARNVYMDYETYDIEISNKTDKTILLDSKEKTTSMYIIDSNGLEYVSYLHEIDSASLMINKNFTKKMVIKYMSSYRTNVEMISLNFADIILDYNEYLATPDKTKYDNRLNINVSF